MTNEIRFCIFYSYQEHHPHLKMQQWKEIRRIFNLQNNSQNLNFDFKSNGVILDVNKNNQQIFINGIKLASFLPTV